MSKEKSYSHWIVNSPTSFDLALRTDLANLLEKNENFRKNRNKNRFTSQKDGVKITIEQNPEKAHPGQCSTDIRVYSKQPLSVASFNYSDMISQRMDVLKKEIDYEGIAMRIILVKSKGEYKIYRSKEEQPTLEYSESH